MTIRYDGRVAIVTGAGSGLGKSHALALAARGAAVLVNDIASARAGEPARPADLVVEEIRRAGGTAVANGSSVSDPAAARDLVAQTIAEFGRVDILVNNAGFLRDRSFAKLSAEDFDAVVSVHLSGAAYCTMAAWSHMREQGYGRVLFTTSNSGLFGNFGQANYAAAKAGLLGLMRTLVLEGTKYGIHVNTIAPMAATPMTETVMDDATKTAFDPALVSAVVAWLCSEDCSETGRIVSTAGGYASAVELMSSPGVVLGPDATAEAIAANWASISDFSGARGFASAGEEMTHILDRLKRAPAAV